MTQWWNSKISAYQLAHMHRVQNHLNIIILCIEWSMDVRKYFKNLSISLVVNIIDTRTKHSLLRTQFWLTNKCGQREWLWKENPVWSHCVLSAKALKNNNEINRGTNERTEELLLYHRIDCRALRHFGIYFLLKTILLNLWFKQSCNQKIPLIFFYLNFTKPKCWNRYILRNW